MQYMVENIQYVNEKIVLERVGHNTAELGCCCEEMRVLFNIAVAQPVKVTCYPISS